MNRHLRRGFDREWNKVKVGKSCTKFLERNGLFEIPNVIFFQAAKITDEIMCIYSVSVFEFKEGLGFPEVITVCIFTNSLFRVLGHIELGFVSEEGLEKEEEVEIVTASLLETF